MFFFFDLLDSTFLDFQVPRSPNSHIFSSPDFHISRRRRRRCRWRCRRTNSQIPTWPLSQRTQGSNTSQGPLLRFCQCAVFGSSMFKVTLSSLCLSLAAAYPPGVSEEVSRCTISRLPGWPRAMPCHVMVPRAMPYFWSHGPLFWTPRQNFYSRFCPLGIEVEKQGFRTVRLVTSQKFPRKNLKSGSSLLTFRDPSSHICEIILWMAKSGNLIRTKLDFSNAVFCIFFF